MDFSFTEEHNDLAGLARSLFTEWAAKNTPDGTGLDRALWTAAADAGILDAALPAPIGGGFGLSEQCAVLTEIGRAVAPIPYLTSVAVAACAIATFGDERQRQRWVGPVASGTATLAIALADEDNRFRAEPTATGWQVTGAHTAVPSGAFADAFLIEADTEQGPLLLIIGRDTAGLRITGQHVVDGTDAALVEMDGVDVGADAVLGAPGDGASDWARRRATIATCALQLGVLARAVELTGEYAVTREQFGKPIGSFQAVRQRLADAHIDVEAVRLTLWQAVWRESEGLPADAEIATAKFWAAEAGHRVAHTMVHVHASIGIFLDYDVHRYFLAAKRSEFQFGAATEQLLLLADALPSTARP